MTENQSDSYEIIDSIDKSCRKCKDGVYKEMSVYDELSGKLHCNKCNHEIVRFDEVF